MAEKKSIAERIEVIANVCVIAAALVFVFTMSWFFLRHYYSVSPESSVQNGTQIKLTNVDWSKTPQTLLLVLSTDCKYCTASMPFYRRLVSRVSLTHNTRLMAIFPQSVTESREYLAKYELEIGTLQQAALTALGVKGTPTLILVDANGVVVDSWDGMVPQQAESEVLASVK